MDDVDPAANDDLRAERNPLLLCATCAQPVALGALRCSGCGIPFRGSGRGTMLRLDLSVQVVGNQVRLTIDPRDEG